MTANSIAELKPMTEGIIPITVEERMARVEKARRLMIEHGIDAVYIEAGTSLLYFTGIDWWRSERTMAAILPARGEIAYVCPAFEEARMREMMVIGDDVRAWEEHESPYELVKQILRDRGVTAGKVGLEESTRFFQFDGIRKLMPVLDYVSADPVTIGCRAYKTATELALMQRAMDITVAAYKASIATLQLGMTPEQFTMNSYAAHRALGVQGGISAQFGKASAFPHGTKEPQYLTEGDIVLMDGGCRVQGYSSDISRTIVFGEPTQRQRDVWSIEKEAQAAAFHAAQLGAPCEAVDRAARKVITDAGFGPGYKVPGLPHRTGHGIGMDGHEWYNVVEGNKVPLAPGMCFTNEPMIAIYGEFGVRLEDCVYITSDGPRFFTQPSPSIEQPFEN